MRILVVDDDASSRKLLTTAFEVEGFEVRAVAEGLDALGALASEKWKPDVMVLDYMMPNFTGGAARPRHDRARHGLAVVSVAGVPHRSGPCKRRGRPALQ